MFHFTFKKALLVASAAATAAMSTSALAGEGNLNNVDVESIAVLNVAFGGHMAGNMEIKVRYGFQLPPNVYCDQNYITTKKSVDSDRSMLNVIRDAKAQGKKVSIRITDSATYQAFAGRCSIMSAQITY